MKKEYQVVKALDQYSVDFRVKSESVDGWKPLFITPIVIPEIISNSYTRPMVIEFLITFEKEIK